MGKGEKTKVDPNVHLKMILMTPEGGHPAASKSLLTPDSIEQELRLSNLAASHTPDSVETLDMSPLTDAKSCASNQSYNDASALSFEAGFFTPSFSQQLSMPSPHENYSDGQRDKGPFFSVSLISPAVKDSEIPDGEADKLDLDPRAFSREMQKP